MVGKEQVMPKSGGRNGRLRVYADEKSEGMGKIQGNNGPKNAREGCRSLCGQNGKVGDRIRPTNKELREWVIQERKKNRPWRLLPHRKLEEGKRE